jgi:hypothetical protein
MSLRSSLLVCVLVAIGCGGDPKTSDEPQTAREKLRREARAEGEDDGASRNWGKWRYTGDRSACFFIVGAKCFKTEDAACQAARCKAPAKCNAEGAAPAQVSCK